LYAFFSWHMPIADYLTWFDHPTIRWVQIMKGLMEFSPESYYFLPLSSEIFLSTLFSITLSLCHSSNFAPIQSYGQSYSSVCFILKLFIPSMLIQLTPFYQTNKCTHNIQNLVVFINPPTAFGAIAHPQGLNILLACRLNVAEASDMLLLRM
jgi:hypothetical protein